MRDSYLSEGGLESEWQPQLGVRFLEQRLEAVGPEAGLVPLVEVLTDAASPYIGRSAVGD